MHAIARPPLPRTNGAASPASTMFSVQTPPGAPAEVSGTADDRPVRLTWRRLDRLASAAALGIVLASPRSALLVAQALVPQVPPSSSPSASDPVAAADRHGVG
jgi:hypothetical protein